MHVTGALASLPGKFREYIALKRYGLNTIELDVKDEGGEIGFQPADVPLARTVGATRSYYNPKALVALAHRNGIYMIGRVVCFQDPKLAGGRPDLAIQHPDGSVWTTSAGIGWVNPYDRRVWDYCASVAEAAAKAGFDQIMFDYVRFPSDGDLGNAVYPGKTSVSKGRVIADFVQYAKKRLEPHGTRVSTAVFGLSATRDLGIGQVPRWISKYVDNLSPMSYPVLYGDGELGLASPSTQPGETVFRTLTDFRRQVKGSRAQLVPWVQDWNYTPAAGSGPGRRGAAPGRQGIPPLERGGHLHEGRTRTGERRPRGLTPLRRRAAPGASRRRPARTGRGRASGPAVPARTRSPSQRADTRPRTAVAARRPHRRTAPRSGLHFARARPCLRPAGTGARPTR